MDAVIALLQKSPVADLETNLPQLRAVLLAQQQHDKNHSITTTNDAVAQLERAYLHQFTVLDPSNNGGGDGHRNVGGDEKPFLCNSYNAVGEKHRSPWTNRLYNAKEDGSNNEHGEIREDDENDLRQLEVTFNGVWDSYKNLYYGHEAVGSVYLKELETPGAFEGLFAIYKKCAVGSWKSASIVRVDVPGDKECMYTVCTSVCMILEPLLESTKADVSVLVSKEVARMCKIKLPVNVSHIENCGTIIEANEIDLRSSLEKVLIPKNEEVMDSIQKKQEQRRPAVNPLMGMMMNSEVLKKKLAKQAAEENLK